LLRFTASFGSDVVSAVRRNRGRGDRSARSPGKCSTHSLAQRRAGHCPPSFACDRCGL